MLLLFRENQISGDDGNATTAVGMSFWTCLFPPHIFKDLNVLTDSFNLLLNVRKVQNVQTFMIDIRVNRASIPVCNKVNA